MLRKTGLIFDLVRNNSDVEMNKHRAHQILFNAIKFCFHVSYDSIMNNRFEESSNLTMHRQCQCVNHR